MKVCVFSPYGRNEVTAAAIRVADLALAVGHDTVLVTSSCRETGISAYWDQRVVAGDNRTRVYRVCRNADRCIWFVNNRSLYRDVELVADRARHVLVPCQAGGKLTQDHLAQFADLVFPTKTACETMRVDRFGGSFPMRASWVYWDSGLPAITRRGLAGEGVGLLVLADKFVIDFYGWQLLQSLTTLLATTTELRITVLSAKTWERSLRQIMRRMLTSFGKRIRFDYQRSWLRQIEIIHQHDVAFIPSFQADFGINVARCLSCSVPVVAYDVSPFNELIADDKNGYLITARGLDDQSGLTVFSGSEIVSTLRTVVSETEVTRLRSYNWFMADRANTFMDAWASILY